MFELTPVQKQMYAKQREMFDLYRNWHAPDATGGDLAQRMHNRVIENRADALDVEIGKLSENQDVFFQVLNYTKNGSEIVIFCRQGLSKIHVLNIAISALYNFEIRYQLYGLGNLNDAELAQLKMAFDLASVLANVIKADLMKDFPKGDQK